MDEETKRALDSVMLGICAIESIAFADALKRGEAE